MDASNLIDVLAVAELLDCSTRHVYRLADTGRMPRKIKLGALVRWNRSQIEEWVIAGCPSVATDDGVTENRDEPMANALVSAA